MSTSRSISLFSLACLLAAANGALASNPSAETTPRAMLSRDSMCEGMPPSLDPYGARCGAEVAKRWDACTASSKADPARLHDCLGFKRPPAPTGNAATQLAALRRWSAELCGTSRTLHFAREACEAEVAARIEWCGPPSIAKEIDTPATARCLGFRAPAPSASPRVLGGCDKQHVRVRISARLARTKPWPGAAQRPISGRTLYVGKEPIVDEKDVSRLELLDGDPRVARVTLDERGAQLFADTTRANKNEYLVLAFDGVELAALVTTAITGGTFSVPAGERPLGAVCSP